METVGVVVVQPAETVLWAGRFLDCPPQRVLQEETYSYEKAFAVYVTNLVVCGLLL